MTPNQPPHEKDPILGEVVIASHVITLQQDSAQVRTIIFLLAGSLTLMMTGVGIIIPIFARRLGEFGDGVEALGIMTMAFSLAQMIFSPIMGTLADRWGRRPLILLALFSFTLVNIGYLLAPSTAFFILVRIIGGALTAGEFPATMAIVADLVPEHARAKWVGIVMGSYGVGFIFGPILGGFLYDGFGFEIPFLVSACFALIAFIAATILVPETLTPEIRHRIALRQKRKVAMSPVQTTSIWDSLPKPLYIFATLLFLDFLWAFAFAFIEPEMIFYMYDELGWTTVQFGLIVGAYGIAMVFGQGVLGQLSDHYGRKPIIILGMILNTIFYVGLASFTSFSLLMLIAIVAGSGAALMSPALNAFYLDISAKQHRSRVLGIKGSVFSFGGVAGPLLVAIMTNLTTSQGIFLMASALMVVGIVLGIILLKEPHHFVAKVKDMDWEISQRRAIAAQASLRGIVMHATAARNIRENSRTVAK